MIRLHTSHLPYFFKPTHLAHRAVSQARFLSTAASGLSATTLISSSPSALLSELTNYLSTSRSTSSSSAPTLLFAASKNHPHLGEIVNLTGRASLGGLSDALLAPEGSELYSIALLRADDATVAVPLRSEIRGRRPTTVGRWVRPDVVEDDRREELPDFERWTEEGENWSKRRAERPELPRELSELSDVRSVVFFSEPSCQGLLSALDTHLHSASKLGLLAASTPFVTGRPHTLLYQGKPYSDGAVGLAFLSSTSTSPAPALSFDNLEPLGEPADVTDVSGNIILTLNSGNATQRLLRLLQTPDTPGGPPPFIGKEEEYFLGFLSPQGTVERVYNIMSGDPSRGGLAVETDEDVDLGKRIQFLRRSPLPPKPLALSPAPAPIFSLLSGTAPIVDWSDQEEVRVLEGVFCAASENGFTSSSALGGSWICGVSGRATLQV